MFQRCIITAGGTREYIDLVRFISNESSGKMGLALAHESMKRGFETILITTQNIKASFKTILVQSTEEMFDAIMDEMTDNCLLFMAAAIADWRPEKRENSKIKKQPNQKTWTLVLQRNKDILYSLCLNKKKNKLLLDFQQKVKILLQTLLKNSKKKIVIISLLMIFQKKIRDLIVITTKFTLSIVNNQSLKLIVV